MSPTIFFLCVLFFQSFEKKTKSVNYVLKKKMVSVKHHIFFLLFVPLFFLVSFIFFQNEAN